MEVRKSNTNSADGQSIRDAVKWAVIQSVSGRKSRTGRVSLGSTSVATAGEASVKGSRPHARPDQPWPDDDDAAQHEE